MTDLVDQDKPVGQEIRFWTTSFWAMVTTVIRLLSGFITGKLIAIFAGAAAFGVISQFLSFVNLAQIGAGSIISIGLTKYVAEYYQDKDYIAQLVSTSFKFAFFSSIALGLIITFFSQSLSLYIFRSLNYQFVLILFGLTLFCYPLVQFYQAIVNGLNKVDILAKMTLYNWLFSLPLIGLGCFWYGVQGALVGYILTQASGLFCAYSCSRKLKLSSMRGGLNWLILRQLAHMSIMSAVAMICLPVSQILLRNFVVKYASWTDVGYWQAMLKISDAYLMLLTTVISSYALPKYARIQEKLALKKEVIFTLSRLMPIVICSAGLIYLLRDTVILLLFSRQFMQMKSLFAFQLLGDIAKIASWILANVIMAKARVKLFVALEVIFTLSYFLLSLWLFTVYGLIGLPLAFCLNYLLYLLVNWIIFWRYISY